MKRTKYGISSGSKSCTSDGWWLDKKPTYDTPTPAYDDLLVSIPYTDVQLDFSRLKSATYYPNGRDFEFTLRKINTTSAAAIVADVKSLIAWLTSLQQVTIKDEWNDRSFEGCSVTSISTEYYDDGWQATVTVKVHSTHARDTEGKL